MEQDSSAEQAAQSRSDFDLEGLYLNNEGSSDQRHLDSTSAASASFCLPEEKHAFSAHSYPQEGLAPPAASPLTGTFSYSTSPMDRFTDISGANSSTVVQEDTFSTAIPSSEYSNERSINASDDSLEVEKNRVSGNEMADTESFTKFETSFGHPAEKVYPEQTMEDNLSEVDVKPVIGSVEVHKPSNEGIRDIPRSALDEETPKMQHEVDSTQEPEDKPKMHPEVIESTQEPQNTLDIRHSFESVAEPVIEREDDQKQAPEMVLVSERKQELAKDSEVGGNMKTVDKNKSLKKDVKKTASKRNISRAKVTRSPSSKKDSEGTRVRKSVDYYVDVSSIKQSDEWTPPSGKGTAVREMPDVIQRLQKYTGSSDELQAFYRVVYGRRGKKTSVKKHIIEFSGLVYVDDDEKAAREKIITSMHKWHASLVKTMMDIFGVQRSGKNTKEELVNAFVDWLERPTYGDRVSKKTSTPKKRTSTASKNSTPKSQGSSAKKSRKRENDSHRDAAATPKTKKRSKKSAGDDAGGLDMSLEDAKKVKNFLSKYFKDAGEAKGNMTIKSVVNAVAEALGDEIGKHVKVIRGIAIDML